MTRSSTGTASPVSARRLALLVVAAAAVPAAVAVAALSSRLAREIALAPDQSAGARAAFARALAGLLLGTAVVAAVAAAAGIRMLARSAAAASDAARREERFLAHAAHELRTPITILRTLAEQALARERDAAGYRAALEEIADEARRGGELVASLLDLARLDTGAVVLSDDGVSIAGIVAAVREHALRRFPGREVEILRADGVVVRANPELLERALFNLAANALKHAGPKAQVVLVCGRRGGEAFLGVEDDGPGIPESEVARLLGRFERGADSGSGTGLGLAIADGIAKAHGGRLEIGRAASGGCRAVLWLRPSP